MICLSLSDERELPVSVVDTTKVKAKRKTAGHIGQIGADACEDALTKAHSNIYSLYNFIMIFFKAHLAHFSQYYNCIQAAKSKCVT